MSISLYMLCEGRPGHAAFGAPFYVGIGRRDRPRRHIKRAQTESGHWNKRLQGVLAGHVSAGVEPTIRIAAICPDKDYAALVEKRAIAAYGRIGIDPDGTLCNIASGGQGPDPTIMRLPEVRQRISDAMKRRNPELRAKASEALALARANPENREKQRQAIGASSRARWADPVERERMVTAMVGVAKTMSPRSLEARRASLAIAQSDACAEARSAGNRRSWQDPASREKRAASKSAVWQDPEKRARMLAGRAEGIAQSWKNPEVRARRIAAIKAARARKSPQVDSKE